jgi:hypothetical protein
MVDGGPLKKKDFERETLHDLLSLENCAGETILHSQYTVLDGTLHEGIYDTFR